MRYIFCLLGTMLLFSCGEKPGQVTKAGTKRLNTDTVVPVPVARGPEYTQFIIDRNNIVTDSFLQGTSWLKYLDIGHKQDFPHGFAALQQPLNDTIHHVCETSCELCEEYVYNEDTTYCSKKGPFIEQFKSTGGVSYFNAIKLSDYYFFLAGVDSSFLQMDDTEYAFLHFMKLKTRKENRAYTVKVVKEDHVNLCEAEKITWKEPVPVYIIENNKVSESSFTTWSEVWECGEKQDYAPQYAFVELTPVKGVFKSYADHYSPLNRVFDPCFVFAFMPLNENNNLLKNAAARSYAMQLMTTKGDVRKGTGLDLDADQHADVFWYDRVYNNNTPIQYRNTVLYIKQKGNWLPVYISNCSSFY